MQLALLSARARVPLGIALAPAEYLQPFAVEHEVDGSAVLGDPRLVLSEAATALG